MHVFLTLVDILDHIRTCEDQELVVPLQVLWVLLKAVPCDIVRILVGPVRPNLGSQALPASSSVGKVSRALLGAEAHLSPSAEPSASPDEEGPPSDQGDSLLETTGPPPPKNSALLTDMLALLETKEQHHSPGTEPNISPGSPLPDPGVDSLYQPPPPENQMIYVKLAKPYVSEGLWAPVWVSGTLEVKQADTQYATALYQMNDGIAQIYE